ncbi:hypothetical protein [Streptomyces sp. NPDC058614]|uniref:hypothetical protein n=1 Tax=Streptomyces sp. NPDC058614 TaxID=3346557 RepID=UPI00364FE7D7
MTALTAHTDRLALGAAALTRRSGRAFANCPRRELLYRLAAGLFGAWMLGGFVLAERRILWLLLALSLVTAWRAGRTIERQREAESALVQYVRDRIGDRNGVLLVDVLTGLHRAGMHEDWDVTALRGVVERLGIPVRDSIKVGGDVSVGVHVDDLTGAWDVQPTPPPAPSESPSPNAVTSDNYPTTPVVQEWAGGAAKTLYQARGEVNGE